MALVPERHMEGHQFIEPRVTSPTAAAILDGANEIDLIEVVCFNETFRQRCASLSWNRMHTLHGAATSAPEAFGSVDSNRLSMTLARVLSLRLTPEKTRHLVAVSERRDIAVTICQFVICG